MTSVWIATSRVAGFAMTMAARLADKAGALVAEGGVWLYQKTLSPALAAAFPSCGCRFSPTCSHYAREALREHGLLAGGALTLRRLAQCGPWHPGGIDRVPPVRPVCTAVRPSLVTRHSSLS